MRFWRWLTNPLYRMSADQFVEFYTHDAPEVKAALRKRGRYPRRCRCGDNICYGWEMAWPEREDE